MLYGILTQDGLVKKLDLESPNPIIIWGNYAVGKSYLLLEALKAKGFEKGVVYLLLSKKEPLEELLEMLEVSKGQLKEAFQAAEKALGRKPIIVVEVPRVVNPEAVKELGTFAKNWGYDSNIAKVIIMASTASAAMGINAHNREERFFVPPLSSEELTPKEALCRFENVLRNLSGGRSAGSLWR